MITFHQLRSALLASDPRAALDGLVRAEMAGRKAKAVYDELLDHVEAVRAMPEYTDAIEDVLGDTMDALSGWVHPDFAYKDPPEPAATLPTAEEIARLPRWARVAFAARCARRVLPLFVRKWPDAPENYAAKLTWAVEVGERSAAYAGAGEDWAPPAGALTCAAYVCDAVINADRDRLRAVEVIKKTSAAVAKFKDKAENIFDPHIGAVFHVITNNASLAIANGIATSRETYDAAENVAHTVIRRDFDNILLRAEEQKWTDDTCVPPSVFGPMWPNGRPAHWPHELQEERDHLTFPDVTVRRIRELLVSA